MLCLVSFGNNDGCTICFGGNLTKADGNVFSSAEENVDQTNFRANPERDTNDTQLTPAT